MPPCRCRCVCHHVFTTWLVPGARYHQGHTLLMEQGFRRRYLIEAVRQAPMRLREGAKELMASLAKADIPLLVLSAGLGGELPRRDESGGSA